ncbi:UPF0721 transmembrane protein YdhB [Paenibacillus sp. J31TS4]|uniref:sulfite exporter TauE/SafE family protein n=1 Tax=Paenibacillus sp. J31TS4 TaxID=2807195 RepID=UPI001B00E40B|nr:sulfite exporter TauE/SafE family protein [Paenibacillus sp. J31TS4]GIP41103.1 UPF0721 transmembrane protein YdhB [Paenibacillus sp. J31TS4]
MGFEIVVTMLLLGLLLGFVGAGGSGFIIAILTVFFGIPIHIALGTALAAMVSTSVSGAFSHYREGNTLIRTGLVVGLSGAVGAWAGSQLAVYIPGGTLMVMTAAMQLLSAFLLWLRMTTVARHGTGEAAEFREARGVRLGTIGVGLGFVTGLLSGTFGIGSAPFIQLGLMTFLRLPPRLSAGTTMLVILPTAVSGGASYLHAGYLDGLLLLQVVAGTMLGSYVGAKFTKRLPERVLKTTMVVLPVIAGLLLLV